MLTGDTRYAHKALVMLDRIAEVYPDMDYCTQSMYATEMSPGYDGKIQNLIHETMTACRLCTAYDAVIDALPSDPVFGPRTDEVRKKLRHGVIQGSLDGVYNGQVRGNYGMHQQSALCAAIASGEQEEIDRAVSWVLDNTGEATLTKEMLTSFDGYVFRDKSAHAEGLRFAFDNLIFREGIGWESSPSYNSGWIAHLSDVAYLLEKAGVRVWDWPKFRRMFRWPFEMDCLGQFCPAVGDCGSASGGHVGIRGPSLRHALLATNDPLLNELGRKTKLEADSYAALFEEIPTPEPSREGATELRRLTQGSRLMGGYGLALLRSGKGEESTAASVYYGRAATEHAHFDRLVLELFGYGRKLIPDLGYPEHAAEGDRPAVWTKNTLSHNTVVVDKRRQDTQAPGDLTLFAQMDGLSVVEVDAPEAYHPTAEYRRTVALVDLGPDARYVIDLFKVTGGTCHDYSTHGFDADFSAENLELFDTQTRGTLAGEDVPYGTIYDDDGLLDPERKGRSYYTYRGGGYSYLYDVRRGQPQGGWTASWTAKDSDVGLKMHLARTGEAIVAHGDPPRKPGNPKRLTYVLLRNEGDSVQSRFVNVLEPYAGQPKVHSTEVVSETENGITLKVRHSLGEDTILHQVDPSGTSFQLVRRDVSGKVVKAHLAGPGSASLDTGTLDIEAGISGTVTTVDPTASTLEIERDRSSLPLKASGLKGEVAHIGNLRRSTAYNIAAVEGKGRRYRIDLGGESLRVGRMVITGVNTDGSGISTKTNLYLANQGYYRGAWLTDENYTVWLPIDDVLMSAHIPKVRRDSQIRLVGKHDLSAFGLGKLAYIYDFGPGDTFRITPRATAERREDGTFRTKANCRASLPK